MIVGYFVSGDPKTGIAFGDSITFGTGDLTVSRWQGWWQRMMVDADEVSNPYASINCAVSGDTAKNQLANVKMLALAKYARFGIDALLANDMGAAGDGVVATMMTRVSGIWNAARSYGVEKVIRTRLVPRTVDNTQSSQTAGWTVGGTIQTLHAAFDSAVDTSPTPAEGTVYSVWDALSYRDGSDDTQAPYYKARSAVFTGTINNGVASSGTKMTVTSLTSGNISVGMDLTGTGVTGHSRVVSLESGDGGTGSVWIVSASQLVASTTITASDTYDGTHPALSGHIDIANDRRPLWAALT